MSSRNELLFERAQRTTPGGVNSPVRAFRQVGGTPRFMVSAEGPYLWDADGQRYVDYINSWGPAILGHADPLVVKAVQDAAVNGLSFGAPTEGEIEMAEEICKLVPSIEKVRLVSSGTEAAMSAIRLARGATGRPKIIKFDGCYHGHADSLLVKAGSGLLTFNNPSSAGVPPEITQHTVVVDYNDCTQLEEAFARYPSEIACVIVEPIAGNMNLVRPTTEFLRALELHCQRHGALLIFDEVMSGFRVAQGGAQALFAMKPDLTVLGKVIGGGLPVAAFGGRADLMNQLSPLGPVYQAGTLSGNPIAVAAGITTLRAVQLPGFYERLTEQTTQLVKGLSAAAQKAGVAFSADSVGGLFGFYFATEIPQRLSDVTASDIERFKRFFHSMLDAGVYFAPSAYEAGFVSAAHDGETLKQTLSAAEKAFARLVA
ncbi:MAG: glutamate-1-semialdehyde 2,1-aminomutase [Burkholderiaceae bacterium]|jgi:glutamate-1-semialdehyde 2,1-aminomutase